jgi:hypothetical protein
MMSVVGYEYVWGTSKRCLFFNLNVIVIYKTFEIKNNSMQYS